MKVRHGGGRTVLASAGTIEGIYRFPNDDDVAMCSLIADVVHWLFQDGDLATPGESARGMHLLVFHAAPRKLRTSGRQRRRTLRL